MSRFDPKKYQSFPSLAMPQRRWPDRQIERAPTWCSVDLRDGNQALIEPMTTAQKLELWKQLVAMGFKEIEVGFPAASSHDDEFVRHLIEHDLIPDDVIVQVLTQAREELIEKTFASLVGVKRAIVHLYNSTSPVQRDHVFDLDRAGIVDIAVNGARMVQKFADHYDQTEWTYQYSPESFSATEPDFALEICNAVIAQWRPRPDRKIIINLPATVEMSTPNIHADQIEWFCDRVDRRDSIIVSLHTHNDRGCGIAAAELGLLAGAERVEGTLFGNGERTGNTDLVVMGMNLYSQGIDPRLDFSAMDEVLRVARQCTQLPIHPRHPYVGELVFTAFSGSHQDAIRKCLQKRDPQTPWNVAYLPIDPADIGRSYQEVIRINSQSGKGGVAYVLERDYGLHLPRWLQIEFSGEVQRLAERSESEVVGEQLYDLFSNGYLKCDKPWSIGDYQVSRQHGVDSLQVELIDAGAGQSHALTGNGSGVFEAFVNAMQAFSGQRIVVVEYSEHALSASADAKAICYVQLNIDGQRVSGVGRSGDIVAASLKAILGAINRVAVKRVET
ncbi:2-isopropylmalate synthase [Gammaproteobacteria bacterium]|nr:2-isopropylmalate synthase [Gammaproteobacteria bacterium]